MERGGNQWETDRKREMALLQFFCSLISTVQFTFPAHISGSKQLRGKSHNLRNWFHYKFMVSNLVLSTLFLITNQLPNLCHSPQICYSTHRPHSPERKQRPPPDPLQPYLHLPWSLLSSLQALNRWHLWQTHLHLLCWEFPRPRSAPEPYSISHLVT